MSRIRNRNTKPEIAVRSLLHGIGYRFTVNGPKNRLLPGKPDIVLPKYRTVIFVHGCFWHGHEHCGDFHLPETRREWWRNKIEGNRSRDARVEFELQSLRWHVVTIWACALKTVETRKWLAGRLRGWLGELSERNLLVPKNPSCGKTGRSFPTPLVADQDLA